jgi:hypothetical protein
MSMVTLTRDNMIGFGVYACLMPLVTSISDPTLKKIGLYNKQLETSLRNVSSRKAYTECGLHLF